MKQTKKRKIAWGTVIGVVILAVLSIAFVQLYHQAKANRAAEIYEQTQDLHIAVEGFNHANACFFATKQVQNNILLFAKGFAEDENIKNEYVHIEIYKDLKSTENLSFIMQAAYLQYLLGYGQYDMYQAQFKTYFSAYDIGYRSMLINWLADKKMLESSRGDEIYNAISEGLLKLAEAQEQEMDKASMYTFLSVFCDLAGNETDKITYLQKAEELKKIAIKK